MRPWSRAIWRPLARARDDERGLTVVEGVVSALILVLGALATLQIFDASARTTYRAAESQVLNNRLQAELEAITQLPYAEIAMASSPGGSSEPNDPRSRVVDTSFAVDRDGSPESLETMVLDGQPIPGTDELVEGGFDPAPLQFSTGDISGRIFRFVTWIDDPCPGCGEGTMKRVIVAATVDEAPASFERSYQEIQTTVADPSATPDENPAPPDEQIDDSANSLWLADTTCDNAEPQATTEDHPAHNTRGRCADGIQTGTARGAPDLLFPAPPELCEECLPEDQELYDYATDVEVIGSDGTFGLTMPWPSTDSCLVESPLGVSYARALLEGTAPALEDEPDDLDGLLDLPGEDPNKHLRMHRWLSPETGEEGDLTGGATLELFTRRLVGGPSSGEICLVVFVRQEVDVPVNGENGVEMHPLEIDVPFVNVGPQTNQDGFVCHQELNQPFFRCHANDWPSEWGKVTVPMELGALDSEQDAIPPTIPAGARLGLATMAKRDRTQPSDGLEFMYGAVGYESRLEIQSDTAIPFG